MRDSEDHDVVQVHLAEGWIGICVTCGWVGDNHGPSTEEAVFECRRHAQLAGPAPPNVPPDERFAALLRSSIEVRGLQGDDRRS
jgi:hypothetical protein